MSASAARRARRQGHRKPLGDDLIRQVVEDAWDGLTEMRALYPDADYAARIYHCGACCSLDAAAAPRDELPPDYPCPHCGRAQTPVTPVLTHQGVAS